MSELKVINAYLPTFDADHNEMLLVSHTKENYVSAKQIECYLKDEADKVIEELKEQVREERSLKVDYKISANDLSDGLKKAYEEIDELKGTIAQLEDDVAYWKTKYLDLKNKDAV